MKQPIKLASQRILLRHWKASDLPAFARLNADAGVMCYFPKALSRDESDTQAEFMQTLIDNNGWGFWAVELIETGEFIGFIGLNKRQEDCGIPNAPFFEIGWRLARPFGGKCYAPEGAKLALQFAFETLTLSNVYAFTTLANMPSRRVMEKLGMRNLQQDFDYPDLPENHPLSRHCLYAISKADWQRGNHE